MQVRGHVAVSFGAKLRSFRRRAGLSQEALAPRSSLHRTEIGLLERGERVPQIDTVLRITNVLSILPGELLDGIEIEDGKGRRQ